jgi:dienelactone hydrolase
MSALHLAVASNDDQRSPNEKNVLKETFEKAKLPAEIEVYSGAHGWCPPDSRVYNEPTPKRPGRDCWRCTAKRCFSPSALS